MNSSVQFGDIFWIMGKYAHGLQPVDKFIVSIYIKIAAEASHLSCDFYKKEKQQHSFGCFVSILGDS